MKVILALNGSITSEASAIYAIRYCRLYGLELGLFHVRNDADAFEEVESSMESIETLAAGSGVACQRIVASGRGVAPLIAYVRENRVDALFCTTRAKKRLFSSSFSDYLTRRPLPCDVAVVRIADLAGVNRVERIGIAIKDARLSVKKFAFFSAMAQAFDAEGEIYSVSAFSPAKRASMGFVETREHLERLDGRLSHYRRLAELMGVKLRLRHAIASCEVDQVLHHSVRAEYDLLVVGGRRLGRSGFFSSRTPLEQLMRGSSVNVIALYPKGDDNE